VLNREQQKEILGLAVAALALLVLFALVPLGWLGEWGAQTFPSGNLIGRVGAFLRAVTTAFAGVAALALPVVLFVGGVRLTGWLSGLKSARAVILSGGLLILLPPFLHIVGAGPEWTGWLGQTLGAPLIQYVGWLGRSLILGASLVILSVATLRFNPLTPLVALLAKLGRGAGKGAMIAGAAGARGAKQMVEKARENAAAPPKDPTPEVDTPEPEEPEEDDEEWSPPWDEGQGVAAGEDVAPGGEDDTAAEDGAGPEAETEGDDEDVEPGGQRELPGMSHEEGYLADPSDPASIKMPLPPLDLLTPSESDDRDGLEHSLDDQGRILIEKLATFGVEATLGGRTTGPVVTQFEVIPAEGVKVARIAGLDADLALAMKARSIRIVAPIP